MRNTIKTKSIPYKSGWKVRKDEETGEAYLFPVWKSESVDRNYFKMYVSIVSDIVRVGLQGATNLLLYSIREMNDDNVVVYDNIFRKSFSDHLEANEGESIGRTTFYKYMNRLIDTGMIFQAKGNRYVVNPKLFDKQAEMERKGKIQLLLEVGPKGFEMNQTELGEDLENRVKADTGFAVSPDIANKIDKYVDGNNIGKDGIEISKDLDW